MKKLKSLKKKKDVDKPKVKSVSIFRILRTAPAWAVVLMILGSIGAMIFGATMPAFSVTFGELFNRFYGTPQEVREIAKTIALIFLGLGMVSWIASYFQVACWSTVGELVVRNLRRRYFMAILSQEVGWMDKTDAGHLLSHMSGDINLVQMGVSEKMGQLIVNLTQLVGGITIALVKGWKMTLVLLSVSPLMVASGTVQAIFLQHAQRSSTDLFSRANSVAEETFGGFRTVLSFVAEDQVTDRFVKLLDHARNIGFRKAQIQALALAVSWLIMFGTYSLGFWYGATLVADGEMGAGDVLTVFFSIIIGAMGLGQMLAIQPDIVKAMSAAGEIYAVIDRVPLVNPNSGTGRTLPSLTGNVEFKNVRFAYPTRPETNVLDGVSLSFAAGQATALVGSSGCGKSTTMQLIERFYDAAEGTVFIDGIDVREFDLFWLRRQIGLVAQEPVLFGTTIEENIRYGKPDATDAEIIEAAKAANAHTFVSEFPDGYKTMVGERGTQLSGGQKQRIAIARAMLKNPTLLLLDEATSALDTESEMVVQEALERLMQGRTTIMIAHRLSTVRNADKIVVFTSGQVLEEGTHDQLVAKPGGLYAKMLNKQSKSHGAVAHSAGDLRRGGGGSAPSASASALAPPVSASAAAAAPAMAGTTATTGTGSAAPLLQFVSNDSIVPSGSGSRKHDKKPKGKKSARRLQATAAEDEEF